MAFLLSLSLLFLSLFHFVLYAPFFALSLPPSFLSFAPAPYDPLGGCLVALAPLPSLPGPLPLRPLGDWTRRTGGSIIAIKWETHKQPRRAPPAAGTSQRERESCERNLWHKDNNETEMLRGEEGKWSVVAWGWLVVGAKWKWMRSQSERVDRWDVETALALRQN